MIKRVKQNFTNTTLDETSAGNMSFIILVIVAEMITRTKRIVSRFHHNHKQNVFDGFEKPGDFNRANFTTFYSRSLIANE